MDRDMTGEYDAPNADGELRRRAEAVNQKDRPWLPEDAETLSLEETQRRFHELRVHQIELEMQNVQMRQSQAKLEASQARYFHLYDMAPVGYCTVNDQGLILEANLNASKLLRLARGALVGEKLARFIIPEDQDRYYRLRRRPYESSEPPTCELRMVNGDGAAFWAQLSTTLVQDEKGAPVHWIVLSDITALKQAETYGALGREVLHILNEPGEFRTALQRVLAVLKERTVFDAVGIRLQVGDDFPYFSQEGFSANFLKKTNSLTARTADGEICRDQYGKVILECACGLVLSGSTDPANPLFTPGGSCWTNDATRLLDLRAGDDPRIRPRNHCVHGNYASVALIPIRDKEKVIGLIQFNDRRNDVLTSSIVELLEGIATHLGAALIRKQTEEETHALQAQLLQAQKMEAIGTLAGGIAHDFNNILGTIFGYAEIARDCIPPDSEAIDYLGKVLLASERAASLVKQILAFSRQSHIKRIPLKLNYMVKEVIKLLRPSLPSTITIKQKVEYVTRSIMADPAQIHQILMNLCTNAFHAMEQTGGVLEITVEERRLSQLDLQHKPELEPGIFVVLSVRDTGPGIPLAIREKIFNPYFTTKEPGKGTGMGLAIIHGIVTGYDGFITCESETGKGTLFEIFFPAIEQQATTEIQPVKSIPSGNEHILLIDDEETLVALGKTMLEPFGYSVTVRTNSLEALTLFQNHPGQFDAVITDQTMPGMTGMDLACKMLQIRPGLPIILCTGHSNLINEEQAKHSGIMGYIMKPYTKQELTLLVRKVLDAGLPAGVCESSFPESKR